MPQPQFSVEEGAGLQQRPYLPIRLHGVTSQKTITVIIVSVRVHGYTPLYQINEGGVRKTPIMLEVYKNTHRKLGKPSGQKDGCEITSKDI